MGQKGLWPWPDERPRPELQGNGAKWMESPTSDRTWADLLTSSPDWGADAAMPGAPTAFLWPGLPATAPHLGPGLGLGIALWAQSEERVRFTREVPLQMKGAGPRNTAVSWADWPAAGEPDRRHRDWGSIGTSTECFGRERGRER